jgi:C4-dicarboxylate-specific signal transduction histidine kinase
MRDADPPNADGARDTALSTLRDVSRAAEVLGRLRALFSALAPAVECIDLNQLLRDTVAMVQPDLCAARVTVTYDLENALPPVAADPVQLQQVVLNLIRNAAEAMSHVDHRVRAPTIATRREGNDHVRVSVRDVGIGIDDSHASKLFTPFFTTKAHGMGIGLCVSRSIVERHRGRLWATRNHDGPGATFCFAIPRAATRSVVSLVIPA